MLIRLATVLQGDLVVVFPSHAALRASAASISPGAGKAAHLAHGAGSGRFGTPTLADFSLRVTGCASRRGRTSGTALYRWSVRRHVWSSPVFPSPALSDPLLAARADTWNDQQNQFVVPHAALSCRQALGGLAWSHWRRNAVVLFDRRLQTRSYGPTILGTLPRCTHYQEPVAQIIERNRGVGMMKQAMVRQQEKP